MITIKKNIFKAKTVEASEKTVADTFFSDLIRGFYKNKMAVISMLVILIILILSIFAPIFAPYNPYKVNMNLQFENPSLKHLVGTDMYGRDVLSRLIYGSRISLLIGLVPTLISMVIGIIVGIISGYYGGKVDFILMAISDMVLAFPSLLLAMVVMYTLGASLLNIFIALSVIGWAQSARVVRSQTMALKNREFVEAAKAIGVNNTMIMLKHILPNCIPQLIVLFTLNIPSSILSEASLSFLGVGAKPPAASWGLMVSNGKEYLFNAPWVTISPGVAILIVVLAFNFLGDGFRDALDPYLKQ